MQTTALFSVAIINYLVVTISDNVLDVAKDFTALLIISDFDDILADLTTTYQNLSEPCMDALEYEGLLVIESTTSTEAA